MKEKKNYSKLLTYLSILLFLNHLVYLFLKPCPTQLPIIATPVGGITDLVENNVNGILIEPGNKKQLYEAILFLIDHPEYLSKMGHQSGKKAEKFYPPAIEKQLDHLYQSLEK